MNGLSLNLHKKDHTFKLSEANLDCLSLGSEEPQISYILLDLAVV